MEKIIRSFLKVCHDHDIVREKFISPQFVNKQHCGCNNSCNTKYRKSDNDFLCYCCDECEKNCDHQKIKKFLEISA